MSSLAAWLIRTHRGQILGPVRREKIIEFAENGFLKADDEVCSANGFWFRVKEKKFLSQFVYQANVQGFNPVSEADTAKFSPDKANLASADAPDVSAPHDSFAERDLGNTDKFEALELSFPSDLPKSSLEKKLEAEPEEAPEEAPEEVINVHSAVDQEKDRVKESGKFEEIKGDEEKKKSKLKDRDSPRKKSFVRFQIYTAIILVFSALIFATIFLFYRHVLGISLVNLQYSPLGLLISSAAAQDLEDILAKKKPLYTYPAIRSSSGEETHLIFSWHGIELDHYYVALERPCEFYSNISFYLNLALNRRAGRNKFVDSFLLKCGKKIPRKLALLLGADPPLKKYELLFSHYKERKRKGSEDERLAQIRKFRKVASQKRARAAVLKETVTDLRLLISRDQGGPNNYVLSKKIEGSINQLEAGFWQNFLTYIYYSFFDNSFYSEKAAFSMLRTPPKEIYFSLDYFFPSSSEDIKDLMSLLDYVGEKNLNPKLFSILINHLNNLFDDESILNLKGKRGVNWGPSKLRAAFKSYRYGANLLGAWFTELYKRSYEEEIVRLFAGFSRKDSIFFNYSDIAWAAPFLLKRKLETGEVILETLRDGENYNKSFCYRDLILALLFENNLLSLERAEKALDLKIPPNLRDESFEKKRDYLAKEVFEAALRNGDSVDYAIYRLHQLGQLSSDSLLPLVL